MKFTPESLLEIYLNGSFTEEAQAEFDKLVRKDPAFAERVTQAVAERLGPPPASLEQIGANLDAKIDQIWQGHKPSPWRALAQKVAGVVLVAAAGTGLYGTYHHYWARHPTANGEEGISSSMGSSEVTGKGNLKGSYEDRSIAAKKSKGSLLFDTAGSVHYSESHSNSDFKKVPVAVNSNFSTPALAGKTTASGNASSKTVSGSANGGLQEGTSLTVSIEMEKAGKVVVTVLDSNGLLVRHLYEGPWAVGEHLVDWDGKDEIGNSVLPGNYTVMVTAGPKTLTGTVTIQPGR